MPVDESSSIIRNEVLSLASKLTPEQQAIDRELNRINRQIRQAFKKLGRESRLAQQYETILYTKGKGGRKDTTAPAQYQDLVRYDKNGVPQLARSKKAIGLVQHGGAANAIMQLGRMQTVKEAEAAMIKAYEKRTGQTVKGAASKRAAVQEEAQHYQKIGSRLEGALHELYRIEEERGVKFRNHDEIKKLSKGRWTSEEDLQKMVEMAEQTVQAAEGAIESDAATVTDQFDRLAGY